jgi:Tfp pilus assembly protein PilN
MTMWARLQQFFARRTGRIFPASVLLVVLFCGSLYGFNEVSLYAATRQLDEARSRSELLRPMREKKLQADAALETIQRKQTVLSALTKDRLSYYAILAGLTVKTPPSLRLTDLEAHKGMLTIGGMAPSSSELALFIERLEQDTILTEPVLVKVEQPATLTANRFRMTVKIKES